MLKIRLYLHDLLHQKKIKQIQNDIKQGEILLQYHKLSIKV